MMSYLQSDTDIANPIAGPAPKETPPEPEYEAQNQRVMGAPRFNIPSRDISAVEIPAIVKNVDRAVKAFGRVPNLTHVSFFFALSSSIDNIYLRLVNYF